MAKILVFASWEVVITMSWVFKSLQLEKVGGEPSLNLLFNLYY